MLNHLPSPGAQSISHPALRQFNPYFTDFRSLGARGVLATIMTTSLYPRAIVRFKLPIDDAYKALYKIAKQKQPALDLDSNTFAVGVLPHDRNPAAVDIMAVETGRSLQPIATTNELWMPSDPFSAPPIFNTRDQSPLNQQQGQRPHSPFTPVSSYSIPTTSTILDRIRQPAPLSEFPVSTKNEYERRSPLCGDTVVRGSSLDNLLVRQQLEDHSTYMKHLW